MLGEGYGSENQIVIQTPGTGAKNVLTRESLLNHVEVVTRATKIEVHLFDEWVSFLLWGFVAAKNIFENIVYILSNLYGIEGQKIHVKL